MNLQASKGMGLKPKGIGANFPKHRSNILDNRKETGGAGIKVSNGMRLNETNNYFKFNEYERKRKYLQMGSHKPKPRKPQQKKEPPKKKEEEKPRQAEVEKPQETREFNPKGKWGAAVATVQAANAFKVKKEKYVVEEEPQFKGSPVASMKRTMKMFDKMLYA